METNLTEDSEKKMVTITWPQHTKFLLEGLWSMLNEKYKVDVELVIDKHVYKIHQIVLSLFCPVFKTYFDVLGESVIKLDDVTNHHEDINSLVEFLYRGTIKVEESKLDNLLIAAENLGVKGLIDSIKQVKSGKIVSVDVQKSSKKSTTVTQGVKNNDVKLSRALIKSKAPISSNHIHSDCNLKPFKECPQCSYSDRCEFLFNRHLAKHKKKAQERQFVCNVCDKEFRSRVGLKQHSLYHGDPKHLFNCTHCQFKTSQRPHFVRHLAVNHKVDLEGNNLSEDFKCELCSYATTRLNLLKDHQIQKHSTHKPFKCAECEYSSVRKWDVIKHVRIVHRDERPHLCEQCGYACKTMSNLKAHVNGHLGIKPYKCKICGQDFATVSSLKMHSRIHATGEKPFVCQLCGHGFLRRYRLTNHMKQFHQIDMTKSRYRHSSETVVETLAQNTEETIHCLLPVDSDITDESTCIVLSIE
ncbi:hypothetical protein CHUAL_008875 [Chamberlinius hualienensis]